MIHLYLDDWRPNPKGFALARSGEECLLMLRECEVDVLSLDFELGHGQMNGGDVVATMIAEKLQAEKYICIPQAHQAEEKCMAL